MKRNQFIFSFIFVVVIIITTIIFINYSTTPSVNNSSVFVKYTDAFGYESTISYIPQKIISLSPNTTEIICSLGLAEKLIGRTDYCDYPQTISSITSIGTITEPNLEVIANLNPDIIITDGMQSKEIITSIRNLGFTVIITRANETLQGTYDIISDIGMVTGSSEKAKQIINNMKKDLLEIEENVSNIVNKKRVYYSISLNDYGIYTAGSGTYINELLEKAGVINIATDMDGWSYSVENLINHNPDYFICSDLYNSKEEILNYSPIANLDAIKKHSIIEIDKNLIERQGPRNIEGIKILLQKIYNIYI